MNGSNTDRRRPIKPDYNIIPTKPTVPRKRISQPRVLTNGIFSAETEAEYLDTPRDDYSPDISTIKKHIKVAGSITDRPRSHNS